MEENKNNLVNNPTNNPASQFKKRTFNEAEQNSGSYNVGLKKQKTKLSKETTNNVLNKMKEINISELVIILFVWYIIYSQLV